ncbi:hypothetical protein QN374_11060, partial [Herbaspirillum sp. RTI4]|uniref:hypothetical protein n=1 Tax=Herbaspirillum sp. RTI4 TaxID=3048640 RepID=UPI002B23CA9A
NHTTFLMINSFSIVYSSFYLIPKFRKSKFFYVKLAAIVLFFMILHLFNMDFELLHRLLRGFISGVIVVALGIIIYSIKNTMVKR